MHVRRNGEVRLRKPLAVAKKMATRQLSPNARTRSPPGTRPRASLASEGVGYPSSHARAAREESAVIVFALVVGRPGPARRTRSRGWAGASHLSTTRARACASTGQTRRLGPGGPRAGPDARAHREGEGVYGLFGSYDVAVNPTVSLDGLQGRGSASSRFR